MLDQYIYIYIYNDVAKKKKKKTCKRAFSGKKKLELIHRVVICQKKKKEKGKLKGSGGKS